MLLILLLVSAHGATWSTPTRVFPRGTYNSTYGEDGDISLARGMDGEAAIVWRSRPEKILAATSTDSGATWSPPYALHTGATSDSSDPVIVAGRKGEFIATWVSDEILVTARLTDGTWSPPQEIVFADHIALAPEIAANANGVVVIAWNAQAVSGSLGGLFTATSVDGGMTFGAIVNVHNYLPHHASQKPSIALGEGILCVAWVEFTEKLGITAHVAISDDQGASYTEPTAIPRTGHEEFWFDMSVGVTFLDARSFLVAFHTANSDRPYLTEDLVDVIMTSVITVDPSNTIAASTAIGVVTSDGHNQRWPYVDQCNSMTLLVWQETIHCQHPKTCINTSAIIMASVSEDAGLTWNDPSQASPNSIDDVKSTGCYAPSTACMSLPTTLPYKAPFGWIEAMVSWEGINGRSEVNSTVASLQTANHPPLRIIDSNPRTIGLLGGTTITLVGGGFVEDYTTVRVGDNEFLNTTVISSAELAFIAPPISTVGYVPVTLLNPPFTTNPPDVTESGILYFFNDCIIPNSWWTKDATCEPCPRGGFCPGGPRVWPLPGYWSPREDVVPIACLPAEACPGAQDLDKRFPNREDGTRETARCNNGYEGRVCSVCSERFHREDGRCLPCGRTKEDGVELLALVTAAICLFVILAVAMAVLEDRPLDTFVSTVISGQQLVVITQRALTLYTERGFLSRSSRFLSILTFEVQFFKPGCALPRVSFGAVYFATTLIVLFAIFVIACALAVRSFVQRAKGQDNWLALWRRRSARSYLILPSIVYLQLSIRTFQAIDCTRIDDQLVLRADLSTLCYKGSHITVAIFAFFILFFFVFGFPLFCTWLVFSRREKLDRDKTVQKLGYIIRDLKPRWFWFNLTAFGVNFIVALAVAVVRSIPVQVVIVGGVFGAHLVAVAMAWPYTKWWQSGFRIGVDVSKLIYVVVILAVLKSSAFVVFLVLTLLVLIVAAVPLGLRSRLHMTERAVNKDERTALASGSINDVPNRPAPTIVTIDDDEDLVVVGTRDFSRMVEHQQKHNLTIELPTYNATNRPAQLSSASDPSHASLDSPGSARRTPGSKGSRNYGSVDSQARSRHNSPGSRSQLNSVGSTIAPLDSPPASPGLKSRGSSSRGRTHLSSISSPSHDVEPFPSDSPQTAFPFPSPVHAREFEAGRPPPHLSSAGNTSHGGASPDHTGSSNTTISVGSKRDSRVSFDAMPVILDDPPSKKSTP